MMRELTKEEKERVRQAFEDESKVSALQTPGELHLFAGQWNYGDFPEPLFSIIRNPECDKGTALYIYWLSDPVSFFELYLNEDEAASQGEWTLGYYRLLSEIQERIMSGFYSNERISIEPEKVAVGELTSGNLRTKIPDIMKCASNDPKARRH
jgi:hypothetical protein